MPCDRLVDFFEEGRRLQERLGVDPNESEEPGPEQQQQPTSAQ